MYRFVLLLLLLAPAGPSAPKEPQALLSFAADVIDCAREDGLLKAPGDDPLIAVIDFRRRSTERRLWVVDADGDVVFHHLVAHGKNTGADRAKSFSNTPGSNQSSVGLYVTAETYTGKHGHSLRLDGLEPGFNDKARKRAIVMHGADYVSQAFIDKVGRLGRSFGCPALDRAVSTEVIDRIAGGTPLLAIGGKRWIKESPLAQCALAAR